MTFYRIATPVDGPPVCEAVEFVLAPAGTPCGYTHLTEPAWGKFEDHDRPCFGKAGFIYHAKDEETLRSRGYAPTESEALRLALDAASKAEDEARAALTGAKARTLAMELLADAPEGP